MSVKSNPLRYIGNMLYMITYQCGIQFLGSQSISDQCTTETSFGLTQSISESIRKNVICDGYFSNDNSNWWQKMCSKCIASATKNKHFNNLSLWLSFHESQQGVYKFNQTNFQEIPGGISRKIQDMFASLRHAM